MRLPPSAVARAAAALGAVLLVSSSAACQRDEGAVAAPDPAALPSSAAARPSPAEAPSAAAPSADRPPATPRAAPAAAPPSPGPAQDDAVTYFRVQGVAAGDRLNVRFRPDAEARVLAGIAPGATAIEGIGAPSSAGAARWQRVRYAGTIGWVNARFLTADAPPPAASASAPASVLAPFVCFGTEPFWHIRFGADGSATCGAMCEGQPGLRLSSVRTRGARQPESFDILAADGRFYLRAAMRETGQCSDGMSDFLYPYEFAGVGAPGELSGCCRLADAEPSLRAR